MSLSVIPETSFFLLSRMEPDPNPAANYNKDYLQRVYQSLLKKGNNISLAELNTAQQPVEGLTEVAGNVVIANQSQIKQTVKIIQSNGAVSAEVPGAQQVMHIQLMAGQV